MGLFGEKCTVCGKNYTKRKNELGQHVCGDCELQLRVASEPRQSCPVDQKPMKKWTIQDLIYDKCDVCHGVWLDCGELKYLKEIIAEDSPSFSGTSFATGFILGIGSG